MPCGKGGFYSLFIEKFLNYNNHDLNFVYAAKALKATMLLPCAHAQQGSLSLPPQTRPDVEL